MKHIFLILVSILVLSACGSAPQIVERPMQLHIDPALLDKCPDLPVISNGKTTVTMGDLMTYSKTVSQNYNDCANKYDSLIDTVKPLSTP